MPGRRKRSTEESLARLRDQLRAEAERHRPDTERIWARVEAAMAEQRDAPPAEDPVPAAPPRRRRGGLWVVATGLSTATVVGVTSLVVLTLTDGSGDPAVSLERHSTGNPPAPQAPGFSPTPADGRQTSDDDAAPRTPPPGRRGPTRSAGGQGAGDALVSAVGSLDRNSSAYWARNNLTLTVRRPLGALDVTVRIIRGRWTAPAGSWTSLPATDLRVETDITHDAIVYRFRLQPGRTVPPGTYLIGVQYHPGGRHDPSKDVFTIIAAGTAGGSSATVHGNF